MKSADNLQDISKPYSFFFFFNNPKVPNIYREEYKLSDGYINNIIVIHF